MTYKHTGVAAIKTLGLSLETPPQIDAVISAFVDDKGYDRSTVVGFGRQGQFGSLINDTLLKQGIDTDNDRTGAIHVIDYAATHLHTSPQPLRSLERYRARPEQNQAIDRVLTAKLHRRTPEFIGEGATTRAVVPGQDYTSGISGVPIAVIGYGPAGIMVTDLLETMGFTDVQVFETRGQNGIWALPNVSSGTRNNPRPIRLGGRSLEPAPGNGDKVVSFLNQIAADRNLSETFNKRKVTRVKPGHLEHTLSFSTGEPETFPIVINASGHGDPVPISDPSRMTGPDGKVSALRWQTPQLSREDAEGKRFLLVGLGNSTAEMLRQFHKLEDEGVQLDYRVITHYPKDSVYNPSDTVCARRRQFRVFRDLNKPDLTSFQGDLEASRLDYYRALYAGRILPNVVKWDVNKDQNVALITSARGTSSEVAYDQLYVLTGYRQEAEKMRRMGCLYDMENLCAHHDYDGEFVKDLHATGVDRVHAGYFGLGSVLDAPHNRNSTVIPGIAFRVPDLLFGVTMRAAQYVATRKS